MDYKTTLNLPETDFPMQANLAKREPEALARWEAENLYARIQEETAARPTTYRLVDGPPYANGDIHIGHAVNKVLKDIIVKSRRLDGHHAPYVPGWDCHGLPIEHQVEKKFGKVGDKIDAKTFRQKCREYAEEQVARQRKDFKRLGVLGDWERPYLTMAPAFEAEQLRCLAQIVDNGHVVRGFKPVHWCLDCASSLAEAEVEYENHVSPAIDVKFPAADAADLAKRFGAADAAGAAFVIWTTTPWTLPANEAIALNAELEYVLADVGGEKLVLAAELAESVAKRLGQPFAVLARTRGAALEGARARHPFADRTVPIILGDHVTLDAGTGLVHTAPAHGAEDYVVGRQYGLPVNNPVQGNGVFAEGTPIVAGMFVRKANEPIIAALAERGMLAHRADIEHSYPHCWRHKTPLIFRATPQWFVSMDVQGLRPRALEAIAQTKWIPGWGEARIREMVAGRPDWCISRQRYWGVPMAVFVHRAQQTLHPDSSALLRKIADRVEREGLEAWFGSSAEDWLGGGAADYEKVTDTLDVWFDSGVVHQCSFKQTQPEVLAGGVEAPMADMYLEGSDQHRGWFQSSLLTSVAMKGHAPYRSVLTHGFTVDENGNKMSKSLGNAVAPQKVTQELGADVLRLWVAASDYSGEIAISPNLLQRMADAYRRIRNTVRFLLGNLHGFDPATDAVPVGELVAIDRWAIAGAARLQAEIVEAYDACAFHLVHQKLLNYCINDLGGCYLDILKDRLYTTPRASLPRRSAQTAMWHVAEAMVRWIAPVLSFTADEIWRFLPGERSGSVFAQKWHVFPEGLATGELDWARLQAVRESVRKTLESLRGAGQIGSGLTAELDLYADGALGQALAAGGDELRFWFMTSGARVAGLSSAPDDAVSYTLESGDALKVRAVPTAHAKCERCWHQRADVGRDPAHPTICGRCIENVAGAGEVRKYF